MTKHSNAGTAKSLVILIAVSIVSACTAQPDISNGASAVDAPDLRALIEVTR